MSKEVRSDQVLPEMRSAVGSALRLLDPELPPTRQQDALDAIIGAVHSALSGYRVLFPTGVRLTEEKIKAIRDAIAAGTHYRKIARKHSVSVATVYRIKNGAR